MISKEHREKLNRAIRKPETVAKRISTRKSRYPEWWKDPSSRATKQSKVMKGRKRDPFTLRHRKNMSVSAVNRISDNPYVRGSIYSDKNKRMMYYRSSYELIAIKIFEQISKIVKYEYETLSISYKKSDGSIHHTIPDFLVYYQDGSKEIIEIKPNWKLNIEGEKIKIKAMKSYAKKNGLSFSVWSENKLVIK